MKFGISVSQINEVDLAVAAERVGYDFCWVWDSPMIRSNLWAVLGALTLPRQKLPTPAPPGC